MACQASHAFPWVTFYWLDLNRQQWSSGDLRQSSAGMGKIDEEA